ncbi:MAG: hypothetical protein FWH35_08355 [Treponema sp.]|nr:hypothetical protein [Treponema sp.]
MKSRILLFIMTFTILFCFIACRKNSISEDTEPVKDRLEGTFWVYKYVSPLSGIIYYYGLSFIDDNEAESIDNNIVVRMIIKTFDYEYKNGEGVFYPGKKEEFLKGVEEAIKFSKMYGDKTPEEEMREALNSSLLNFTVSDDVLTLSGSFWDASFRGEMEFEKHTLEEMQEIFRGYRSN